MTDAAALLVDLRPQVKAALENAQYGMEVAVRQRWPMERAAGAVVTYEEYSNVSTDCPVVDEVTFQIDLWADDRETVRHLAEAVNAALCAIGLRRVWCGEDCPAGDSTGRAQKSYRYSARLDKRWMRSVKSF